MDNDDQLAGLSGKLAHINLHAASASAAATTGLVRHVTNAHRDDIHGMISIHDRIITGSKDTSVRMWRDNGDAQGVLFQHPYTTAAHYSYKHWITALHTFSDGSIIAGSRNGYITCQDMYTNKTYYTGILEHQWSARNKLKHAAYKQRNEPRITSIMCQEADGYSALIGMPEKFMQFDLSSKTIRRVFKFDTPDWVYGFSQVTLQKIAVIHACTLSLFEEIDVNVDQNGWQKTATLLQEGERVNAQRPFISDINRFEENHAQLAMAFFGGITRVIDLEHGGGILHEGREHQQRVWKALPMNATSFLSCADDGLIKVWDVRQAASVRTYTGHPDRVSALALLNNSMFVAASCPAKPFEDPDKGQLFFYDKRM